MAGASQEAGFASAEQVVAHYGVRTGLDLTEVDWYIAFGFFKLAVVAEGIFYRHQLGKTVGQGFERYGEMVPWLVRQGNEVLSGRS
jgi:aminoglycoside phosphotransferase (APT) family kinase protein